MSRIEEQGDLYWALVHQVTQNGMLTKTWSSQKWESDELMEDRTGDLLYSHSTRTDSLKAIIWILTEMSLESRSFLHKLNDQVRKSQNQSSKDATNDSEKHSVIWRMF